MRNLILPRGKGKTTRLLALSEWRDAPIICVSDSQRRYILDMAKQMEYNIPNPITAGELVSGKLNGNHTYKEFLVDEAQDVVDCIISCLTFSRHGCVIGMTTTDERGQRT